MATSAVTLWGTQAVEKQMAAFYLFEMECPKCQIHAVIPSNGRYGSQRVIYFLAQVLRKTWTRQSSVNTSTQMSASIRNEKRGIISECVSLSNST